MGHVWDGHVPRHVPDRQLGECHEHVPEKGPPTTLRPARLREALQVLRPTLADL